MKSSMHQIAKIMHRHSFQSQSYSDAAINVPVVPITKQYIYSSFIVGAFYTSSILYASDHNTVHCVLFVIMAIWLVAKVEKGNCH